VGAGEGEPTSVDEAPQHAAIAVTLEQTRRLRITRKGLLGAVNVTVSNVGDAAVEAEIPEVHGLVFEAVDTGELHVLVHPCQCVMNVKKPESLERVTLQPGESHEIALDEFGCGGSSWRPPPAGEYRVTYRVHTASTATDLAALAPADGDVHDITDGCRTLYASEAFWEGAVVSDPITIALR